MMIIQINFFLFFWCGGGEVGGGEKERGQGKGTGQGIEWAGNSKQ